MSYREAKMHRPLTSPLPGMALLACAAAAMLVLLPAGRVPGSPGAGEDELQDEGIFPDLDGLVQVRLPSWVPGPSTRLVVDKAHRVMSLYLHSVPLKSYPIALGFSPVGTKHRRGDGRTPEGSYTIVERLEHGLAPRYGARSLRISYPGPKDAALGLRADLIDQRVLETIAAASRQGVMPPQDTPLGSSIRIHGGGAGSDWTAGCVGMRDEDVVEVYDQAPLGTPVVILARVRSFFKDADRDGIPDQADILRGAKKTVLNKAAYGTGYLRLDYPGGDVPRGQGVCTDVVVRALRNAGLDLQVLLQRDIKRNPARYPFVRRPNRNIDHRRVRTLLPYFKAHWRSREPGVSEESLADWLPGDVVFMDTMRGPGADHLGIVSDRAGPSGLPLIINNWCPGCHTSEMDLLGSIRVTHRFRVH